MKVKHGYYDVFVRTCAKYPSNIAVRHYQNGIYKTFTYSELYGVCEYISQNMQQLQCSKGIIGLVSERNVIIPCVIAAAHKCSTTFMFLNPTQDIETLTKKVKFKMVITVSNEEIESSSPPFSREPVKTVDVFDLKINFYNFDYESIPYSLDYSFITMTSGSTGQPKHIQVPIQCIQPNVDDLTKLFNISPQDIIYFSTPLTFDPSMIEILLACINGASLLIAPEKADILFPTNPQNSITVWQVTPSRFFQFSNADIKNKILHPNSTLKILAFGGEPLNGVKRLKELKHWENKTKIFTLYGVSEMSCWACVAQLDLNRILSDKEVPLGDCLSETQIMVEPDKNDKNMGKILLVSKTRKCVILNSSQGADEENSLRFIDTGDMGELKNGTIYYRGRRDDTIKRFGHKINLQFIEATIMQCPRVKTCSCIWLPKPNLLVVYFSSETMNSQEVSDFLKCKLDDKHWPDKIIRVTNLPTNPHGKISKLIMSKLFESMAKLPQSSSSLRVSFLKEVQSVLSGNISYEDIKNKNFFAIGGTSFLAVAMCNKLSQTCPMFGKLILPYLISQKLSIEEIIQIAEKEICGSEQIAKKRSKRSRSDLPSQVKSPSLKKSYLENVGVPVEFIVLWNYDTGKCVDASPVLFQTGPDLYVTVGSHSGKLVVLDAIAGIVRGVVSVRARLEAAVLCWRVPGEAARGVVGAYDGTIVCFTLEDCKVVWRICIKSMVKSKAVCCDDFVYVAAYDGKIRCIDKMTGEIKSIINIAEQAISADLVLAKNQFILAGTLSGTCFCVHAPTSAVSWRGTLASPVFASPVLYDEDKYVLFAEVNGEIHCRTVEKGIKIWRYQGAKGNIFSSLYIREIVKLKWQVVFGCHDSHVYSIMIKNFQPSLSWKTELPSPVYATPCGLNEKLILAASNNGKICAIDGDSGAIVAEHILPEEVFSSPAVYGDYIFIGCRDDNLYSLKYVVNF